MTKARHTDFIEVGGKVIPINYCNRHDVTATANLGVLFGYDHVTYPLGKKDAPACDWCATAGRDVGIFKRIHERVEATKA